MKRWMGWWILLLAGCLPAAFVPPAEGGAPFRRDKLPVDVATMTGLSAQLVTLAERVEGERPQDARTRAQLIGLALALDPANRRARELGDMLQQGGEPEPPDEDCLGVALSRTWNLLGWLEQPEAGADGQALGACLSDVLAKADPGHPQADRRGRREAGRWDGWVAELAAFRRVESDDDSSDSEPPEITENDERAGGAELRLRKATVRVPLWVRGENPRQVTLATVPLEVRVRQADGREDGGDLEEPGAGLRIGGPYPMESGWARKTGPLLSAALEARHGPLPEGLEMRFTLPEGLKFDARNHGGATGAMLVAADALFTGVEPERAVLAELRDDGGLGLPTRFWHLLRTLADDPDEGGGLILPDAARDFLPYLLTVDQTEFFMRQEVLLAADAGSMISLASSSPPERLPEAGEIFSQIRELRGTRSLGSFVSLAAIRQRFGRIVELVPEHASARVLGLRGTSKWPQRLDRPIYAREIRSCLEPLREVLGAPRDRLDIRQLQDADHACRENLKFVERLHGLVEDREQLHDPALSTVKSLAGLISTMRRQDEFFEVTRAILPVVRSYVQTVKLLTAAAGDEEDYPIPFDDK